MSEKKTRRVPSPLERQMQAQLKLIRKLERAVAGLRHADAVAALRAVADSLEADALEDKVPAEPLTDATL